LSVSRARVGQVVLALGVSVLLLWWALRDAHLDEALAYVRAVRLLPLLGSVLVATSLFPIRLVRWHLLLRRADGGPLPWVPLWHAVSMGFAANNLLPFRAGELVRTVAASRLTETRLSASLSSVAVERVFDALTVVGLLAAALFLPGLPADVALAGIPVRQAATTMGLLAVVALLAAGLVVAFPLAAERIVRASIPSDCLAYRLVEAIEGVRHGLGVLRSPGRLALVVLLSVVLWLVNALSFYLMFRAFDLTVGYLGAMVLQGILVFGIALPSAPGYVGPFEAVITAVLGLYGVGASQAAAYALTYHVTTFIPITLLGLWSAARTGLGFASTRAEAVRDG
jgi:glycosyltransferase 2 family protein